VKSKSHLVTVKYFVAQASMQCQLEKFQETFCLKNHPDWTATNILHIYMDGCWVITKCLSETERCAEIQNSIPSQQHNSKRSKGLTIITFHLFSYQHNSLGKCESWDTSYLPMLIFTDVLQMHVLTNFLNSLIYDNFYKNESRKSSCSTVNAECIWLHLRKPQRLNVWSKVQ
jgi:hypothetical protein